jgi:cell division protein FtsB
MKKKVIKALKNKYILTPVIFLVWMSFFNDIDLFFILKSKRELRGMEAEIAYLEKENKITREALDDISTNAETLEKFARETYFMKRPNEDIYIVRIKD